MGVGEGAFALGSGFLQGEESRWGDGEAVAFFEEGLDGVVAPDARGEVFFAGDVEVVKSACVVGGEA